MAGGIDELLAAVDAAFARTGRGLRRWPDPHPDRDPRDEEYSRLLDPGKWRIVGARADAWIAAITERGVATLETDATVTWREPIGPGIVHVDRLVPRAPGALALAIARTRLGDLDGAGVVLGLGEPAIEVGLVPDCGCDACDSGSQNELDHLDDRMVAVLAGGFRHLTAGDRSITALGEREWRTSGSFGRREVDAILADPSGWHEVTGASWV